MVFNHPTWLPDTYIRGVNLGGWLVVENFLTPYFYSLTECDLRGDFRYFPDQVDAPPLDSPDYKPFDAAALEECPFVPFWGQKDGTGFPNDEWSIVQTFRDANGGDGSIAERYFDIHYDNHVKREDVAALRGIGVTHLRVPLGHWILGDIEGDEPYIPGRAWEYLARLVGWAREEGLQVWPDLHGAPGSQNGFDNSGHINWDPVKGSTTCIGWDANATDTYLEENDGVLPPMVRRTLRVIDQITKRFVSDGMRDVVTGFGLMNEPFGDCNRVVLLEFYDQGLELVRKNMGDDVSVYVGDRFQPWDFKDGWWADESYKGTYLDR